MAPDAAVELARSQVNACGVCGYGGLTTMLDMGDQPLAETLGDQGSYPLILMECRNCSLVQLSHAVPQARVFPPDHPYTTANNRQLVEHYRDTAIHLMSWTRVNDLWVDIGANDGTLLRQAVGHGLRLAAVEPTNQARKCLEQGFITYQQFFGLHLAAEIVGGHGTASVVTATNVLAHVPDVHDFMAGVATLLADDGVFVTENHDLASITDGLQIDTIYHEHLRYFSLPSLSRLLAMHDFQIEDVTKIPTHGGSLRVTARKRQRNLGPRAREAARKLRVMCEGITAGGGLIYGIGASTRATPLIHYAQLAFHINRVVEVSGSEKIGHLIPGTQIFIADEAELIEQQPEYALIFAWHIAGIIMPRLRKAGYKGSFIIPLPEPFVPHPAEYTDG